MIVGLLAIRSKQIEIQTFTKGYLPSAFVGHETVRMDRSGYVKLMRPTGTRSSNSEAAPPSPLNRESMY